MVLVNGVVLFVEYGPDLLLTPNTAAARPGHVERVLVDPGVPRGGQTPAARLRVFERLLAVARDLGPREVLAVLPDDWDPSINARLARRGLGVLRMMRLEAVPVIYVHGYLRAKPLYDAVLGEAGRAVVGVPARFNTLRYPVVARCSEALPRCAGDVAWALSEFDAVHVGGPPLRLLRMIPGMLRSPFASVRARWVSADTMAYRWRHGPLPLRVLTRGLAEALGAEYLRAFLARLGAGALIKP